MRHLIPLLLCAALAVPACDPTPEPADAELEPRDYDPTFPKYEPSDYELGCAYDVDPPGNDDYPNTPADCLVKHTLVSDNFVVQCANNGTVWGCSAPWEHSVEVTRACLDKAIPQ